MTARRTRAGVLIWAQEPLPSESSSSMSLALSCSTFEKDPTSMKFRTGSLGALKV
jgi:hypothetical protein